MPRKPPKKNRTADGTVEIDRETWQQWRMARARAKAWTERAQKIRELIEAEIADNDYGTINGVPVISWKPTEKPHKFNQARFKKDHPDLFAEYYELVEAPRPFSECDFDPELIEDYPEADQS
jgi:hypothetical protein